MPVFGHALAVGHTDHLELVADQGVQGRAEFDGLVQLGQDDTSAGMGLVGVHDVFDGVPLSSCVDDEQLLDAGVGQQVEQFLGAAIALGHAGGVDQDHLLAGQQFQQVFQRGAVVGHVHGHAQDAAVGAQLFVSADAVGVQGDQAQVGGTVLGGKCGRQLGR